MRGQTGVMHPRHSRVRLQPLRQRQRLGALGAQAQAQGFQPLEHHPGVEGREHHAGVFLHRQQALVNEFGAGADRTGHDAALAVEVFGARVQHDVGAEFERALQRRGGQAVVHRQPGPGLVRQIGQGGDVADLGERIGGGFGQQQAGFGPNGCAPGCQIGLRHAGGSHAKARKLGPDQLEGGAKHGLRIDHMIARLEQGKADQREGRHARRRGQRGWAAFERGQALLEAGHGRAAAAAVGVAILLTSKAARGGGGAGLHKTAAQVQRFGVLAVLAALDRHAQRQRVAVQGSGRGGVG